jgi:predicted  nucleic acid-binding Zn-ribbon protein
MNRLFLLLISLFLVHQFFNKINYSAAKQRSIKNKKIKSQKNIEELEAKIKDAKAHLSEIIDAAEDAWENLKNKFDNLADDIGSSFKRFFGKDE